MREGMRSVMLMTTYKCPLACSYCQVDRGPRHMDPAMARRGVDFLYTTRAPRLQLSYFGGEPLLEWDLVRRTILYAQSRGDGRPLRHHLATNGLLLDKRKLDFLARYDTTVLLSLDGPRPANDARLVGVGDEAQRAIVRALALLKGSGVRHFVNTVVRPERAAGFDRDLAALEDMGATSIQFGYQVGTAWSEEATAALLSSLDRYLLRRRAEFLNIVNDCEPVMLKNEILVDVDGSVYLDGAVFLETNFPGVRSSHRLGSLDDILDVDTCERTPREVYELFLHAHPLRSRPGRLFLNNVRVGQRLQRYFAGARAVAAFPAEDPEIRRAVIEGGLEVQDRFVRARWPWLDRAFLFLKGGCDNDCLFCQRKPPEPLQPHAEIAKFLAANVRVGRRRLAIVGNEPLLSADLEKVVAAARLADFSEVEVMTSGTLLDAQRAMSLARAGVASYAVSLHGSTSKVHDKITGRPGSFRLTLAGVEAARAAGARVYLHANACRPNLADLPALEALAARIGLPLSIHPLRPKGPDGMNIPYDEIAPDYAELAALAGKVSRLVGFPRCVMRRVQGETEVPAADIADSAWLYLLHQAFMKPEGCRDCGDASRCSGTFEEHLRHRPLESRELTPS